MIGAWGGLRLLRRYGRYVRIDERRIKLGHYLFLRHGGKVVFFGRFTAVLRTYAAFLAGTLHMEWKRFLFFNASGGIIWSLVFGLGAYWAQDAFRAAEHPGQHRVRRDRGQRGDLADPVRPPQRRAARGAGRARAAGPAGVTPREFTTLRGAAPETRPIAVRDDVDAARSDPLLERLAAVGWGELHHAYGPAADVPGQLAAVIVGDDDTREEAWWNLWGNIHHQGTTYEATAPAVPILVGVAEWREHPGRAEAILMLREIADVEGAHEGAERLLSEWPAEPEPVRRALLWLLSVMPELRERHGALVTETLPERFRRAWEIELAGPVDTWEDSDAIAELEEWIHGGEDT